MARRGKGKGRAASPARGGRRGRSSTQQTRASPSSSRNDAGNTPGRPASAEPEEYISAEEIVMLAASPQKKQKYVRWTEYEDGVFLRALSIYRREKEITKQITKESKTILILIVSVDSRESSFVRKPRESIK